MTLNFIQFQLIVRKDDISGSASANVAPSRCLITIDGKRLWWMEWETVARGEPLPENRSRRTPSGEPLSMTMGRDHSFSTALASSSYLSNPSAQSSMLLADWPADVCLHFPKKTYNLRQSSSVSFYFFLVVDFIKYGGATYEGKLWICIWKGRFFWIYLWFPF